MADSHLRCELATIHLGLGSNLGDRMDYITSAIGRLSQKMTITELSSVYETEPVGYKEQPLFLNAVLAAVTGLSPFDLLRFVKDIESDLGRKESFRNAPRIIDIDILLYGDEIIDSHQLIVPHPRMTERAFVLVPLVEIAPKLVHPIKGKTFLQLLKEAEGLGEVRKWQYTG